MWEIAGWAALVFAGLAVISRLFESTFNFVVVLTGVICFAPPLIWLFIWGGDLTLGEYLLGMVVSVVWLIPGALIASSVGAGLRWLGLWREPLG